MVRGYPSPLSPPTSLTNHPPLFGAPKSVSRHSMQLLGSIWVSKISLAGLLRCSTYYTHTQSPDRAQAYAHRHPEHVGAGLGVLPEPVVPQRLLRGGAGGGVVVQHAGHQVDGLAGGNTILQGSNRKVCMNDKHARQKGEYIWVRGETNGAEVLSGGEEGLSAYPVGGRGS